jgi:hypothetical protein
MVAHLAVCDECIVRYAALMDSRPVEASPQTSLATAVEKGHRVPVSSRERSTLWPGWRSWQVAAGALAALLTVVVLLPTMRERPDDRGDLAVRSTSITLVEPVGSAALPAEFSWASPIEAARFRVELYDSAQRELLSATVEGNRLRLPEDVRRQLQPGGSYEWRVTALDADGQPMMQSDLASFVVADR